MTNPDLQKTIRALENYLDPNHHIFDMNNVRNAIALLKAQQEQIEQLTDRVESKVHGYNKLFTELQAQQERIAELEAEQPRLRDQEKYLLNAENILRQIGYTRCTAAACNCYGYHKETDNE
jgi:DNA repair exonuclease SbcCD ATPase subunit